MDLPSTQAGAMAMGLALHNGSHPAYSVHVSNQIQELVSTYKAESATNPEAAANFVKSVGELEDKLRRRLDRRYVPGDSQLLLTSKDPYAAHVGPGQLDVTQVAEAVAAPLQAAVDMAKADPRSAYPNAALADKNCEAAKELTVEQLQQVTDGLREKGINIDAFANPGIPARAPAATFMEALKQEAEAHPYKAGAAALGVGLIAVAGGAAALGLAEVAAAGAQVIRLAPAAPTLAAAALFAGSEVQQTMPPPDHRARPVPRTPAFGATP